MSQKNRLLAAALLFALSLSPAALGAEPAAPPAAPAAPPAPPAEPKPPDPPTHTVEAELLKIDIPIKGIFESPRMTELSRTPEAWAQMKALSAAEAGVAVKKGDVLVELDPKDLDKRIRDIEQGRPLALLKIQQAQAELRMLELTTPENLKLARQNAKQAEEDFKHYMKSNRAFQDGYQKNAEEGTDLWLEAVKIELRELEKMYEADDLIEATEKLVLARQKHQLKRTELGWKKAQIDHAWKRKVVMARELETQRQRVRNIKQALARAEATLELALNAKRLEVGQMTYAQADSDRMLRDLKADREGMTIRAPAAGLVYYGRCVQGYWPDASRAADMLKPGGQLAPQFVFLTIVSPERLFVRAYVEEQHLHDLRRGVAARVVPTGYPDLKLDAKVESVHIAPGGPGPYAITLALSDKAARVLPGMTCSVTLRAYRSPKALTVPAASVFTDPEDEDEEKPHVYVVEDGKPVKRVVKLGRRSGDKIEILKGLSAGSVIRLERPAE